MGGEEVVVEMDVSVYISTNHFLVPAGLHMKFDKVNLREFREKEKGNLILECFMNMSNKWSFFH